MAFLLSKNKALKIKSLPILLKSHTEQDISSLVRFLLQKRLAYISDKSEASDSPILSKEWDIPCYIQTLSVEAHNGTPLVLEAHLDLLRTDYLIIYCKKKFSILTLLKRYRTTRIKGIDLIMSFSTAKAFNFHELIDIESGIRSITVYNAKNNIQQTYKDRVIRYQKELGKPEFFVDHDLYLESRQYHPYFNSKMHITAEGKVKNSYDTSTIFGDIQTDSLLEIALSKKFKELWFVNKSLIDICHDCEFRRICVENRIPHKRSDGKWFCQEECNYNPYLSKEFGEEGYLTLAETGILNSAKGLTFDIDKFIRIKDMMFEFKKD